MEKPNKIAEVLDELNKVHKKSLAIMEFLGAILTMFVVMVVYKALMYKQHMIEHSELTSVILSFIIALYSAEKIRNIVRYRENIATAKAVYDLIFIGEKKESISFDEMINRTGFKKEQIEFDLKAINRWYGKDKFELDSDSSMITMKG